MVLSCHQSLERYFTEKEDGDKWIITKIEYEQFTGTGPSPNPIPPFPGFWWHNIARSSIYCMTAAQAKCADFCYKCGQFEGQKTYD